MIIDHFGIHVSKFETSREFYLRALAPLGYGIVMEFEGVAGFGVDGKPEFWIAKGEGGGRPAHIAFKAGSREKVRQFYDAAMAAGGADNGPPGIREMYHPDYYGAFVLDPDGYNIEAVCHDPE